MNVTTGGRSRKVQIALLAAPETVPRELKEIGGANPVRGRHGRQSLAGGR